MCCDISFVEIKAMKMWKVYIQADDGQQAIKKAHLSFQLNLNLHTGLRLNKIDTLPLTNNCKLYMAAYFATFYQIMSTCLIFMSTSLQLVA